MKTYDVNEIIKSVLPQFDFTGEVLSIDPYGSGHINDTFLIKTLLNSNEDLYVLQRLNTAIFKNPDAVMENILNVTEHIRKKYEEKGKDSSRSTMSFLRTKDGFGILKDEKLGTWRMYHFIDDAMTLDLPETQEDFYQSAVAFGTFQKMLSDFPAETLHETIKDFHNTPDKYNKFLKAIEQNLSGRLQNVSDEVNFVHERKEFTHVLLDALNDGIIPLRVTHNDTKLNNVLLDSKTRKQVCVIDLDTIMPGFSVTDFGDSIRFGASTAAEDEKDLDKVHFDINLFEIYLKGFIEGCDGQLTSEEIEYLPEGAKMMTLECGMRFLTDYLDGDTYFKTSYPEHNLDRCRTQFKLVSEMEEKWDQMKELVRKYK